MTHRRACWLSRVTPIVVVSLSLSTLAFFGAGRGPLRHNSAPAGAQPEMTWPLRSLCPEPELAAEVKAWWPAKKQALISAIHSKLSAVSVVATEIYGALYVTQVLSQHVIEMAEHCSDTALLEDLVEVYSAALPYLKPYRDDGWDRLGGFYLGRGTGFEGRRWLESGNLGGGNDNNDGLTLGQFDHAIAHLLRIISNTAPSARTPAMNAFKTAYLPVVVNHMRWKLWNTNTFGGWPSCRRLLSKVDGVSFSTYIEWLRDDPVKLYFPHQRSYCAALTDADLWWSGIAAQLKLAALNDPAGFDLAANGLTDRRSNNFLTALTAGIASTMTTAPGLAIRPDIRARIMC